MKNLEIVTVTDTSQLVPKMSNLLLIQQASREMIAYLALDKIGISLERLDITQFYLLSGLNLIGSLGLPTGITSGLGLAYIINSNTGVSEWELIYIAPSASASINYTLTQLYINIFSNSITTVNTIPYDPQPFSDGTRRNVHNDREAVISISPTAGNVANYQLGGINNTKITDCRDIELFPNIVYNALGSTTLKNKYQRIIRDYTANFDMSLLLNIPFSKIRILFEIVSSSTVTNVTFVNFPATVNGLPLIAKYAGINDTLITTPLTAIANGKSLYQLDIELCPYVATSDISGTDNNYYTFQKL